MIVHQKFKFLLIAMGTVLLCTGTVWSGSPFDNERESTKSIEKTTDESQAIDQDGKVVTHPRDATDTVVVTPRDLSLDVVEPRTVLRNVTVTTIAAAGAPDDEDSAILAAPILDPDSSKFSFQALLTDGSGNPISGPTVELQFKIYDGGGTLLEGPIVVPDVPIVNGIVDTQFPVTPKFFDGTARELGVIVNRGSELSPRVKLVAVPYALRVDRVGSAELDDLIDLGDVNAHGQLKIWNKDLGLPTIQGGGSTGILDATDGFRIVDAIGGNELMRAFNFGDGVQLRFKDEFGVVAMQGGTSSIAGGLMSFYQSDGGVGVRVSGDAGTDAGGRLMVYDAVSNETIALDGNNHRVELTADNGESRARLAGSAWGVLSLYDGNGLFGTAISDQTVILNAGPNVVAGSTGPGNDFGGQLTLTDSGGTAAIYMNGGNNSGSGTRIATTGSLQIISSIDPLATELAAIKAGTSGGVLFLAQGNGLVTVELDGDAGTNAGGDLFIRAADGSNSIFIDGDSGGAGLIEVRDNVGSRRVRIDGESIGTGGEISVFDNNGTETIELLGDELSGGESGAQIMLRNASGVNRIEIDAVGGSGARIQLYNTAGSAVILDGEVNGGGRIRVRNASNSSRIFIDGDYNGTGLSRIRADIFRVQGGVDLAEPFECKDEEKIQPGMVMSIDPNSPGKLMMSTEAYDRKVAGVISGAGGVRPGITLSQEGVMDKGHLVALTGRVYCRVDASNGSIVPGDMLTTSNTHGHAMKVRDYERARGAIIGKAMTPLETGTGLVLVLVQPQ